MLKSCSRGTLAAALCVGIAAGAMHAPARAQVPAQSPPKPLLPKPRRRPQFPIWRRSTSPGSRWAPTGATRRCAPGTARSRPIPIIPFTAMSTAPGR